MTITKADSPQAQRHGSAASISLFAGCATGTCTFDQNSINQLQLSGSRVTIEDDLPPVITAVQAGQGLLAAGVRSGAEPITFSASENSGIRLAEIGDVTDAANPTVVASEDYNTGPNTNAGTRCDYTRPRPCPDVKNETIAAPTSPGTEPARRAVRRSRRGDDRSRRPLRLPVPAGNSRLLRLAYRAYLGDDGYARGRRRR